MKRFPKLLVTVTLLIAMLAACLPAMASTTDVDTSNLKLSDEKVELSFWYR